MPNGEYTVESRLARLERWIIDVERRVDAVTPLVTTVIQMGEQFRVLHEDVVEIKGWFSDDRTERTKRELTEIEDRARREHDDRREARKMRIQLWTIATMIVCALIGGMAVILATGVHG